MNLQTLTEKDRERLRNAARHRRDHDFALIAAELGFNTAEYQQLWIDIQTEIHRAQQ